MMVVTEPFRQPLLEMLAEYGRRHPTEVEVARQIAHLVAEHDDCLLRTCRPGHLTGSAWVLSDDGQRCLLVHHRKLERWLQPGGHADGEPDLAGVARREAEEETGLTALELVSPHPFDIDIHQIPARYDAAGKQIEDAHDHHDLRYLFVAGGDQSPTTSDESHDVRWFDRTAALAHAGDNSVRRMIDKAGPHAARGR